MANVSLLDFCDKDPQLCNPSSTSVEVTLAGATPARTFPLIDPDGVVRYYPQAVVRQMQFPPNQQPQCSSTDMYLIFNTKANFFFQSSNTNIASDQYDFLTIAVHE